jgi:hypothetical protein
MQPIPNSVTPRFKSLIKSCWASDVSKRPSFTEILQVLEQIKREGPPLIRLDDTNSKRYRKAATVFAHASKDPITILKDTGKSLGKKLNILIASATKPPSAAASPDEAYWSSFTDLYMCDPEVFARTYEPSGVHEHEYRKTGEVRARRMDEPFAIRVGGASTTTPGFDTAGGGSPAPSEGLIIEQGSAGDYIVQNAAGDQWVADGKTMDAVYSEIPDARSPSPEETSSLITHKPAGSSSASTRLMSAHGSTSTIDGEVIVKLVGMGGGTLAETHSHSPTNAAHAHAHDFTPVHAPAVTSPPASAVLAVVPAPARTLASTAVVAPGSSASIVATSAHAQSRPTPATTNKVVIKMSTPSKSGSKPLAAGNSSSPRAATGHPATSTPAAKKFIITKKSAASVADSSTTRDATTPGRVTRG